MNPLFPSIVLYTCHREKKIRKERTNEKKNSEKELIYTVDYSNILKGLHHAHAEIKQNKSENF